MAELVEARVAVAESQLPRIAQVVGYLVAEQLECALDAGARGDRGLRAAAQVGVVEVHQPVRRGADLAALPQVLPGGDGGVGTHQAQHRGDLVAVPHDHAVDAAHLAGLRRDLEPPRSADESHRGLVAGAADLEGGRPTGIGERAVRQECTPPDGGELLAGSGREAVREAAHGTAAGVQQAGLARQGLSPVDHTDEIRAVRADVAARDDRHLAPDAVQLGEVLAEATGDLRRVELRLDRDAVRDDVKAPGESQQCREFRRTHRRLPDLDLGEFLFDVGGQCQSCVPFLRSWVGTQP